MLQKGPEKHYVEDKSESGPNFEQRRWEEEHLHAALLKFGARDAKSASKVRVVALTVSSVGVEQDGVTNGLILSQISS